MWVDKLLTFCDGTSVAHAAGNLILGDVVDVQQLLGLNILESEPWIEVRFRTKLDSSGGAATFTLQMKSDSTADLATSATILWTGPTVAEEADALEPIGGGSKANSLYARFKMPNIPAGDRYFGFWYTIAGETSTTGTVDIYAVPQVDVVKIAT